MCTTSWPLLGHSPRRLRFGEGGLMRRFERDGARGGWRKDWRLVWHWVGGCSWCLEIFCGHLGMGTRNAAFCHHGGLTKAWYYHMVVSVFLVSGGHGLDSWLLDIQSGMLMGPGCGCSA